MKQLYFLLGLTIALSAQSQSLEFLNANNVNAGIGVGGNLFSRLDSSNVLQPDTFSKYWLFEAPKGSDIRALCTSSIWMSGFHASLGVLHCAAQTEKLSGGDYYNGPISTLYDTIYERYYKRVYKVTKNQIEHHRSHPTAADIDTAILYWPAKGNVEVLFQYGVEINSSLASFVDANHNGVYDPRNGDYPAICGDEAIFFVFNDVQGPHHDTRTNNPLGIEIRGLAYEFYDSTLSLSKAAINNTVFVSYEIENKSGSDYRDFYFGLWEDPDVGCFSNDRIGCDTGRNLMFAYNGIDPDPDCQMTKGYKNIKVAQGTKMLNHTMGSFGYTSISGVFGDPPPAALSCFELRNYQRGYWRNGTPFTYGGTGYQTGDSTKFIFPGDLNDSAQWSELHSSVLQVLPPSDRRMFGSFGPMNFNQNEVKHFDFAFFVSYDSTATMISIVDTLKRDADIIQEFYDNTIKACKAQIFADVDDEKQSDMDLILKPNPANGIVTIQSSEPMSEIIVSDIQGKEVLHKTAYQKIEVVNVSAFASGLYILAAQVNDQIVVRKLLKD